MITLIAKQVAAGRHGDPKRRRSGLCDGRLTCMQ